MTKAELKPFIYSVSTLSSTIIGVGLFSLPYITLKMGFWSMIGYFLVLGTLVLLIHYFFGELSLATPDRKRLPGFAKIYLGNWAEKLAYFSIILGIFGAILAYLIVGGEFLESFLAPFFGGGNLFYTIFYFVLGAVAIFFGIKFISKIEFWGLILFFVVLIFVFLKERFLINIGNLFLAQETKDFFLPYGPVLFSLWGATLIPEVEEMLGKDKKLLKKAIILATFIPIIIYLFFIYIILGICGFQTTESALTGLRNFVGEEIVMLMLFFGILATFTSFISMSLTLRNVFWYDLKINKNLAFLVVCFFPLFLFLVGIKRFIPIISVVGGVMLGIDGILILLMYGKIRPEKKFLTYPLILVFLAGILYEIIYFIK